jgi:SET domain-containing protein
MDDLEKFLQANDTHNLNRLVATRKLDKNAIIAEYKDRPITLYCDSSKIHGLGVFTKEHIKKGQLIETVNIIALEFSSKYHKDLTILNYCYAFPENTEESKKHGSKLFIFTGFGMMYNHQEQDRCNARWLWDIEHNHAKLIAISNILPNSEITINYGIGYWDR